MRNSINNLLEDRLEHRWTACQSERETIDAIKALVRSEDDLFLILVVQFQLQICVRLVELREVRYSGDRLKHFSTLQN